ncbi:MAG: hypothetical protein M0R03_23685 [Novosphingobium sp.]|nr:hypothetical protein [Novosphingobium sp.]
MEKLYTIIDDIARKENDNNIMIVEVSIEDDNEVLDDMLVELDMDYMGINWDGEFEDELSKDFKRAVDSYYTDNGTLPNALDLRRLVEQNYYNMTSDCQDNDNVDTNNIVINELPINNFKQLSYSIYQDETAIEDEKKANECLEYLNEHLSRVKNFLEETIWDICEDNEEISNKIQYAFQENSIDTYQLGDLENFISTINIIKEEK